MISEREDIQLKAAQIQVKEIFERNQSDASRYLVDRHYDLKDEETKQKKSVKHETEDEKERR
jgi:hypothetical protein